MSEASRLSRLVDKLLDLSRLQGGAAAPRQVSCSIEEIIDAALEQMPSGAEGFELKLQALLPPVYADAMQLERALANLLENARRFSHGEPVSVSAKSHGGHLRVSVSDRGPGIPEEQLELVFEPFYRGQDDGHPGSGLGLAIVKGFVEANGGHVWAESEPGAGATFVVELPPAGDGDGDGAKT